LNNQKTCIQSFFLQIWYASLIKLNWCIHLHNVIHNVEAILMYACIKKCKYPCHKQNPNVIPNMIQYVHVIPLWNAPKLKLLMIWSWHKNSNKFSNIESYLHFEFMIWIHASMEMYNFNLHISVITTTLAILLLSNFVVSRIWQNFLKLH
jgi:hypothetical protein